MMDRRRFLLTSLAGAVAMPLAAGCQQAGKVWQVAILVKGSPPAGPNPMFDLFVANLRSVGWIEGRNISFIRRFAEGNDDRLKELAAELVRLKVDIIVVTNTSTSIAARQATVTIPIVMTQVADPIGSGLVTSLAHPGGNVTGMSFMARATAGKEIQFLREIAPRISRVTHLWDLTNPGQVLQKSEADAAALTLGIKIQHIAVGTDSDLDNAMTLLLKNRPEAVAVGGLVVTDTAILRFAEFAVRNQLPTCTAFPRFVQQGFLLSWGPAIREQWQRAASYVDKILKGAKPADLPVEQPTVFDLVINLKTAKALGLTIPPSVLARADQVIE